MIDDYPTEWDESGDVTEWVVAANEPQPMEPIDWQFHYEWIGVQ